MRHMTRLGAVGAILVGLAATAGEAAAESLDDRARAIIASFDHTNIKDVHERGAWAVVRDRFKPGTAWHAYALDAPDPEWLPGWRDIQALRLDDHAWAALVQARINKTWTAQCEADFAEYVAGWQAIATAMEPELAALEAERDIYRHVAMAHTIVDHIFRAGNERRLWMPKAGAFRYTGPYYDMLARVAAVVVGRSELAFRLDGALAWEHAEPLAKHGRSWGTLDDERRRYCAEATDLGTHRTYKLYRIYRDDRVARAVRWPTPPAEAERLAAAARVDPEASIFKAGLRRVAMLGGVRKTEVRGAFPRTDRERELVEALRWFGDLTVVSADAKALVLTRTDSAEASYDCVETDKIDHVDERGRVVYRERCKTGVGTSTITLRLAAGPLPTGVTLKRGDVVSGYALVEGDRSEETGDDARSVVKRSLTGRLHMIDRIKRGDNELGRW